ncbi:MAG: TPM domain-containing protein, partial [Methylophilaceae bacterium]
MRLLRNIFIGLAFLFALGAQAEDVAVPLLEHRVTDLTGSLSPDQQAALESKLAQFEQQKGSQIAILLVPTTKPEEIEQYSIRVVDAWKIGRKQVDDG